jgi:hypothetical protein
LKTDIPNFWFLSVVNDTGDQLFAGVTDTGQKNLSAVSLTPVTKRSQAVGRGPTGTYADSTPQSSLRMCFSQCCGSALFLPQCGSGYKVPNQCGSIRIRILVRLCRHKKLELEMKNLPYLGRKYVIKHTYEGTKANLKGWNIICYLIFL